MCQFLSIKADYYKDERIKQVGMIGAMCHQFMLAVSDADGFASKRDVCTEDIWSFGGFVLFETSIEAIEDALRQCIEIGLAEKVFNDDGTFCGYNVAYAAETNEIV